MLCPRGGVPPRTSRTVDRTSPCGRRGSAFVDNCCCAVTPDGRFVARSNAPLVLTCVSHTNLPFESRVLFRYIDLRTPCQHTFPSSVSEAGPIPFSLHFYFLAIVSIGTDSLPIKLYLYSYVVTLLPCNQSHGGRDGAGGSL